MSSSLCSFVVEIECRHGSSEVKDIFLREGASGFSKQLSMGLFSIDFSLILLLTGPAPHCTEYTTTYEHHFCTTLRSININ